MIVPEKEERRKGSGIDADGFVNGNKEEICAMQNTDSCVDGVKNGITCLREFSNREVLRGLIITKPNVDCGDESLLVRSMECRERNTALFGVEEIKIGPNECKRLARPDSGILIDWDHLKTVILSKAGLGIFAHA